MGPKAGGWRINFRPGSQCGVINFRPGRDVGCHMLFPSPRRLGRPARGAGRSNRPTVAFLERRHRLLSAAVIGQPSRRPAVTIARMPAFTASGSVGHAVTMRARSGSSGAVVEWPAGVVSGAVFGTMGPVAFLSSCKSLSWLSLAATLHRSTEPKVRGSNPLGCTSESLALQVFLTFEETATSVSTSTVLKISTASAKRSTSPPVTSGCSCSCQRQSAIRKEFEKRSGRWWEIRESSDDFTLILWKKDDEKWEQAIKGVRPRTKSAIFVIQSDKFGQRGSVLKQLPVDANSQEIISALLSANESFSKNEKHKVYSDHVVEGRRKRIYFEGGVKYGEDRPPRRRRTQTRAVTVRNNLTSNSPC